MASTIKIKNSSTTGAVPTSSDLVQGELAINVTDRSIYTENASGTVVKLNAPSIDDKNTGATKHVTIDTSGNLGLGVTPSAWYSSYKALQVKTLGFGSGGGGYEYLLSNIYIGAGDNYKYVGNGYGVAYEMNVGAGKHIWKIAGNNTSGADAAATVTQAMTLDASGNLGIGETSPAAKLHVSGANLDTTAFKFQSTTGTNASAGRFTNTGGNLYVGLDNSTGSRIGAAYAGAFWHEGAYPLIFGTSNAERARIDSSGNLLVGTTSASNSYKTTIQADSTLALRGATATNSGDIGFVRSDTNGLAWRIATDGSNFYIADADFSSYAVLPQNFTGWGFGSDRRIKKNIEDLQYGLAEVMAIQPKKFDYISNNVHDIGFIAQELRNIVPEAVTGVEVEYLQSDTPQEKAQKTLSVSKDALIPVLVKAIQEQQAIITSLTARIEALEA